MAIISIIIPVYNAEKFLKKCLDSALNQTLTDIEVICVNDCSPDNSLAILEEYTSKDRRIKFIDLKENKGASFARNTGIKESTGDFIAFLDSDDFIDSDFYEKLYNKHIETNADVIKGSLARVDDNYNTIKAPESINPLVKKHKAYFYSSFTTAIYKANIIKKHNIDFLECVKIFEDPYFSMKLMPHINKVSIVDSAKYYYLSNPDSQTNSGSIVASINDMGIASLKILEYFRKINLDTEHYTIIYTHLTNRFINYAENIKYGDDITLLASKVLSMLTKECLYLDECLNQCYLDKKKEIRKEMFMSLRKNLNK